MREIRTHGLEGEAAQTNAPPLPLSIQGRRSTNDPVSAFGSVIAFNRPLEKETAEFLMLDSEDKSLRKFVEVIIAPAIPEETRTYLFQHKNLRVVEFDPALLAQDFDYKILDNALLLQNTDTKLLQKTDWVTEKKNELPEALVEFGLIAVRQLRSNAIAVVRQLDNGDLQLLGMGTGQPNRVNATHLALERSYENLKNEYTGAPEGLKKYQQEAVAKAVLVSDAFFPFADNIDLAGRYGIKTILQPGGSIRDKSVIKRCDELGMAMAFTGLRHFKH